MNSSLKERCNQLCIKRSFYINFSFLYSWVSLDKIRISHISLSHLVTKNWVFIFQFLLIQILSELIPIVVVFLLSALKHLSSQTELAIWVLPPPMAAPPPPKLAVENWEFLPSCNVD